MNKDKQREEYVRGRGLCRYLFIHVYYPDYNTFISTFM